MGKLINKYKYIIKELNTIKIKELKIKYKRESLIKSNFN